MANARGNPENLKPVRSKEEARKRGSVGGKKSGVVRRRKRDAKEAISLLLGMAAQGNLEKNLKAMGYEEEDWSNMNAFVARIFTDAISGNTAAQKLLLDYGGFHPDQKLKDKEKEARISAIERGSLQPGEFEEVGDMVDVHIYMPDNGRDKEN